MHSSLEAPLWLRSTQILEVRIWRKRDRQRLLAEECSRLKAQVNEVEGTMKETLESVDNL